MGAQLGALPKLPGAIPGAPVVPSKPAEPTPEEKEKKLRRVKQAKSLADMFGVAYAAGDVYVTRKILEPKYDLPQFNTRQVNDLADSFRDAVTESFGDREIGPWTMVLLLTFGIPISMWLQAKRKPTLEKKPDLRSVPPAPSPT
jgi:hypothetical protein